MIPLSRRTKAKLLALFRAEHAADAERLLVERCGDTLPLGRVPTPEDLERIRFAAIRASGGDPERLREAVNLAALDWRDLLLWAGFASDPNAHARWEPRILEARTIAAWKRGARLGGVDFGPEALVEVVAGPRMGVQGWVTGLVALEPEARYLVTSPAAGEFEETQRALRPAS